MTMTRRHFLTLRPRARGAAVYLFGCRPDMPGVPNEPNPYARRSRAHREWDEGQFRAMLAVTDGEE